jgi:hypothetical protein
LPNMAAKEGMHIADGPKKLDIDGEHEAHAI